MSNLQNKKTTWQGGFSNDLGGEAKSQNKLFECSADHISKVTPSSSSSSSSSSSIDKDAAQILLYLNDKSQCGYRPVPANLNLITARLNEGATLEDCIRVIDAKVAEWGDDPKWSKFLRPKTLFGATNFANYAGDVASGAKPTGGDKWE